MIQEQEIVEYEEGRKERYGQGVEIDQWEAA